MESGIELKKFHPQLTGKRILFIDKSMFTPGYVSHMKGLERMNVTVLDNLKQIPDLSSFMEEGKYDFALIHSTAINEVQRIIEAVKKGKIIVVQEKNPDLELNRTFNRILQKSGVKVVSRSEPDLEKAFFKSLDYLAAQVKKT